MIGPIENSYIVSNKVELKTMVTKAVNSNLVYTIDKKDENAKDNTEVSLYLKIGKLK